MSPSGFFGQISATTLVVWSLICIWKEMPNPKQWGLNSGISLLFFLAIFGCGKAHGELNTTLHRQAGGEWKAGVGYSEIIWRFISHRKLTGAMSERRRELGMISVKGTYKIDWYNETGETLQVNYRFRFWDSDNLEITRSSFSSNFTISPTEPKETKGTFEIKVDDLEVANSINSLRVYASFDEVEEQEIARKAYDSTVLLVLEDANGQALSIGSGFFVRPGEIASNLHVVQGAARGYVKLVGQKTKHEIQGITAINPHRGLVVFKISAANSTALPLGNSDAVQIGEPVYAVGNPQGLEGTFSQGIVSSIRDVGTDELFRITAPISPGSSGGPVLNARGEVIGVSVATFKEGQNLNFAIPSDYLSGMLETAGPVKPLARAISARKHRSILSDAGVPSSEGVVGSHFSWIDNSYMGYYTFSVRNQLRQPVRDVSCLVIFYASDGLPIETEKVTLHSTIGANLAKRSPESGRSGADQVRNLTARTEIRVLDFRLAE